MAKPMLYIDIDLRQDRASLKARIFPGSRVTGARGTGICFETSAEGQSLALAFDALSTHREIRACSHAVVLVPDLYVAFRHTCLPWASPKKIAQVLPLELDHSLPWPEQPYLTDFLVQKPPFADGSHLVYSASVPESLVRDIATGLKGLGVSPRLIAPRAYTAAQSFLSRAGQTIDVCFVFFAPEGPTIVLASGAAPVMVRRFSSAISPNALAREIHRTWTAWGQLSGQMPDLSLILCQYPGKDEGSSAMLEDFQAKALSGTLKALPPCKEISVHTGMADHLSDLSPASLINFCKGKFDPGGLFKKYLGELITAAVIGALAAALFFAGLYLDVTRLDGQVSQLRSQAAAIYRQTFPDKPLDPDHSPLLLMQSHIKAAKQDQSRRDTDLEKPPAATGLDLLYFLSKSVPKAIDADLTRLLFNQDHATLTGTTDNFNTVDRLKTALEKSSLFTSVTILTAEAEKTGNRVMFKFRVEME